ncbi:glycosyltransferase [Paenarthrobacter nitroguajacolicus]|uniref:glycosyltransferase n=1 Tax=Paenarthrobacter nitroguajacolicus TaxID=211146 RepID=UPI003AEAAC30
MELHARGIDVTWRVEPESELALRATCGELVSRRSRASYDLLVANDFRSLWQAIALDGLRKVAFVGHGAWQFSPIRARIIRLVRATTFVVSKSVAIDAVSKGLTGDVPILPLGPGVWSSRPENSLEFLDPENLRNLTLGSVARLDPIKRLPMFARVTASLGVRAALVVPRPASEAEQELLDYLLTFSHIDLRVGGDVSRLWTDIDVFLSTSEAESLGLAHLEALQSGVPVVSTAANGPEDFLIHELNGGWIPQANEETAVSEVKEALTSLWLSRATYWDQAEEVLRSRNIARCADLILSGVK